LRSGAGSLADLQPAGPHSGGHVLHGCWPRLVAQIGEVGTFSALYALTVKSANAFIIYTNLFPTHAQN
jgi:hypothetical protein